MFSNLKDFISLVQDGISSNNNLRQTLHEVQKVKYIFREKSKPMHETKVNYCVGGTLLDKYQEQWAEMHENAEKNYKFAEDVDKMIIEIHDDANSRLVHAKDLAQSLTTLPRIAASVDECIDSLKEVQELMKVVERELQDLEDVVERSNIAKWKLDHHYHLSLYKEKKLAALEDVRGKLAKENSERNVKRDRQHMAELQTQRSTNVTGFNQDIAQYLTTGHLPKSSTQSTQKLTLDQVRLDEDSGDLDKFLNS